MARIMDCSEICNKANITKFSHMTIPGFTNRSLLAIDRSALTQQAKSLGQVGRHGGSGRSRCSSVVSSASVSPTSSPTHPSSSSSSYLGDGGGGGRGGRRRTSSLSLGSLSLDARRMACKQVRRNYLCCSEAQVYLQAT